MFECKHIEVGSLSKFATMLYIYLRANLINVRNSGFTVDGSDTQSTDSTLAPCSNERSRKTEFGHQTIPIWVKG